MKKKERKGKQQKKEIERDTKMDCNKHQNLMRFVSLFAFDP